VAANLEQIGTEAIVKGFNAFMSQMQSMDGQYQKTAGTFTKQSGKASSAISGMIGNVVSSATGFALATKGLDFVLGGIQRVTTALPKLAISAAPLPGIAQAFNASTQKTGVSLEALRGASRGTVADFELMRTANVALTGAGEMLGQEMGQKLPGLMEIARASAKATGKDVNFLFDSLVSGVKRGSPMLIDNTGLVLKLGEANATMAAEVGIAVEDLTAEQKQVALLNATLEAGQGLVSQFGAEQASAAENLAAIRAQTQNVTDTIGLALQSALITITGTIASLVERFSDAIQEGGALYPVLVNLGAALSIVADAFSSALNWVIQWVSSFQSTLFGGMNDTASGMLNYGVEIVASLAEGIVSAASTILIQAMNFIGSVLSSWLAPGSPPKVAPQLDKWGAGTFTEYLKGFGKADFSVLDTVQSTLKKYMSGADFASISADLARGLSMGEVDDSFFASLRAAAGDLGPELERLVRDELQLASAIEQVRKAEESLTKAQEAESDAQEQIEALTDEYNELLRTGASKELLKAKLLEINAAEKQKSAARAQRREAEGVLSTAEDQAGAAQDQVDSQKQILTQLEEMVEEQKAADAASGKQAANMDKLTKGLKGAGKAASALSNALSMPMGGMEGLDIAGRMSEAVDAAKEALSEKLSNIFEPLTTAWENVQPTLTELSGKFVETATIIIDAWNELSGNIGQSIINTVLWVRDDLIPAWNELSENMRADVATAIQFLTSIWETVLQPALETVCGFISESVIPLFEALAEVAGAILGKALEVLAGLWENILQPALETVWAFIKDNVQPIIETLSEKLGIVSGTVEKDVNPILRTLADEVLPPIQAAFDKIGEAIGTVIDWLGKLADKIIGIELPDWLKPGSPTPLELGLRGMAAAAEAVAGPFGTLGTQLALFSQGAIGAVVEALAGLVLSVQLTMIAILQTVTGFIAEFTLASEFILNILRVEMVQALAILQSAWIATGVVIQSVLESTLIAFQVWYDAIMGEEGIIPGIILGFNTLTAYLIDELGPAFDWFMKEFLTPFREGLERVVDYIVVLIGYVKKLKDALKKVDGVADNLSGHSPSPLEKGLRGAGRAMQEMYRVELPRLQKGFQMQAAGGGAGSSTVVNNTRNVTYNLAVNTTQGAGAVTSNYHMMRAMAGVS